MSDTRKSPLAALTVCAALFCLPVLAAAQDNTNSLPDNPSQVTRKSGYEPGRDNDSASAREVTWRSLPGDFLHDQKGIWLFPGQLAKGRHWAPTIGISAVTAGLIFADPHAMPYFRTHARNLDDINDVFDSPITTGEVIAVPAGLLAAGYIRHDQYQVSTALLAGEAYADSAIVDLAMKAVTRRKRPSDVRPGQSFNDTFFSGGKSPFKGSSFPSGHAAGVFSVATVVAERYRRHRWVPVLALRVCHRHQLLARNHAISFPIRRISWGGFGLHHYAI